jgi:hypothetical protein
MELIDGQDRPKLVTLTGVLYSSQLQYNLVSTIRLAKKGVETLLSLPTKTSKLLMGDDVIAVADIINNQYVLRENFTNSPSENSTGPRALAKLAGLGIHTWHARMGHLGFDNLIKLQNQAEGMNLIGQKPAEICGPCMIGRQERSVNRTPRTPASKFLEIVHSDLGGPLPRTRSGHAYYITFRDDWSGATWVHLLRSKDQAFEAFKNFQVNTERSADGAKIITLRGDNAGEYIDQKFQSYLTEQGINWDPRAPYVPEQNGEAERLNRTLMYKVRPMLNDRKIPKGMWGEVIKTAAYLSNRSPHYQHKTPYEMIKGKKPDLSHLRIIGSTAWVHIPKEKTKKLDDRSWKGIHVGYEGENQYRIYNPRTGKIHIARDVKFDEITSRHYQPDENSDSSDDDFWTHEDDKLLDPNFEVEDSGTNSRSRPKPKTADNRAGSPDLGGDLDPVGATDPTNDPTNALDQMMENLNLGAENHPEIFSGGFPADDDQADEEIVQPQAPRRSGRERKAPKLAEGIIQYDPRKKMPRTNVVVGDKFAHKKSIPECYTHMTKVLATLTNSGGQSNDQSDEPQTLNEATQRSDWPEWEAAMRAEFNSLVENQTWDLVKRPNQNVITGRWTFKLKRDRDGNPQRYKARWVAHGFKQRHGVDFDETFASVVKPVSYKSLMAISTIRGLQIRHMDVVTAFLYGLLDEDVYVIQPHMFEFGGDGDDTLVCKLKRALYGLKQAPKVWYDTIHKFLTGLGFKRSNSDHAVFTDPRTGIFLAMYVDDLLLFGPNLDDLQDIQDQLKQRFKMTDLGQLSHYLGMEITITPGKLVLTQSTYLKKVLNQFGMEDCRPVSTPMEPEVANLLMPATDEADQATVKWYQQLIGSLMWPAVHTRPDLAYSVGVLSRYAHNPSPTHCALVKRVLRYIAGTINVGLTFKRSEDQQSENSDLTGYSDSDFAGLKDKRHSTGGYVFMLADGAISHSSKQQPTIALSSCEAEYMALSEAAKEAIWIRQFLHELEFRNDDQPVLIFADNKGAIDLTTNPLYHKRTKHIEVRWHWIREMVDRKKITLRYLPTSEMVADGLTKPLPAPAFNKFRTMLNLSS